MTQKILAQCPSAHLFLNFYEKTENAKAEINDKLNYNTHFQTTFSFCIIFGTFSLKSVLKVVKSPIFCIGRGTNTDIG
jgi:VanZ family protein